MVEKERKDIGQSKDELANLIYFSVIPYKMVNR